MEVFIYLYFYRLKHHCFKSVHLLPRIIFNKREKSTLTGVGGMVTVALIGVVATFVLAVTTPVIMHADPIVTLVLLSTLWR